jgi:hypothetical protein
MAQRCHYFPLANTQDRDSLGGTGDFDHQLSGVECFDHFRNAICSHPLMNLRSDNSPLTATVVELSQVWRNPSRLSPSPPRSRGESRGEEERLRRDEDFTTSGFHEPLSPGPLPTRPSRREGEDCWCAVPVSPPCVGASVVAAFSSSKAFLDFRNDHSLLAL